ncbi:Photosynthetic apparatus regulatory protein RegA (plasmid) [Pseudoalteromonas sp. THAF3]|uniref:response regulator transcription factor n=1 Tax=Pseudoalteromonas sp. THAF3 TaxID=2587843 RepID=UPI001268A3BD|nr:response regulator [Pseudoalteromonas sp. THAF3]QFU06541.1 Photosynthetic apparatus regulatory protein RegA [Pseudoalteromonas sp. THAF3]
MKLLLIEDDLAFARTLMRRLEAHTQAQAHADCVQSALFQARQLRPSHIILDMNLNNESGLQLLAPLRALLPSARIILLTGFASIATAVKAVKLGADDYLAKPVSMALLLATMEDDIVHSHVSHDDEVMSPERLEWEHIQAVLTRNNGNISQTARQLNMHRRTLQRKLQKKPVAN